MFDVDFNVLLIKVFKEFVVMEFLSLKCLCKGKILIDDGSINEVWDLFVDLEKCQNLGFDKLDVLKDVLNNVMGGELLFKDVKKFEEKRKSKVFGCNVQ